MDAIIQSIVTVFNLLIDAKVFEIPILVWFLIPPVIGVALKFISGKK